MTTKGLITVRSSKGQKRHAIRSWGDVSGRALCGRRANGWTIEPDEVPNCKRCLSLEPLALTGSLARAVPVD